jgi:predicted RecB family endonuclease
MAVREKMIATSNNDEAAARMLAEDVGVEMIRFLPAFRSAASQGRFVYFQLDSHWDSEGSELAARVTADALNARFAESGSRIQTSVSEVATVRNSAQTDAQR